MTAFTTLTNLNLRGNNIGDKGARTLSVLSRLTNLDLGRNVFADFSRDTSNIGPRGAWALSALTRLTSLILHAQKIGDEGARELSTLTSLATLDLWANDIGDEGARALSTLTSLTSLKLGSNHIGKDGARALSGLTDLTTLDLSACNIGDEGAHALSTLTSLTFLDLSACDIGDDGAKALSALTGLTSLDLSAGGGQKDNLISTEGAEALSALTSLTNLHLLGQKIGTEGAGALSALTSLSTLNLGGNGIGAQGAKALASLITLTSLDLRRNGIGDEGGKAISGLTALNNLYLDDNGIGDEGAKALAHLTGLTSLSVGRNRIGKIGPLRALDRLEKIDLSNNAIREVCPEIWLKPRLRDAKLYEALLGDVPREVLSQSYGDNCLPRLRAYLRDSAAGQVEPVLDIKVMLLGNGRIGKTQISNRMRGKGFEENADSTHGVRVHRAELPAPEESWSKTPLHIWDFGGQDVYLGTHALFLRTRAVFPVVWTPQAEAERQHTDNRGLVFRNFPLEYWVRYVAKMAGRERPVVLIQNQADGPGDRRIPPKVDPALLERFAFHRDLAYSAKTKRGHATLIDALQQAVAHVHKTEGLKSIPGGWAWVKGRLEEMREEAVARRIAGRADPALNAIAKADFETLCAHPDCIVAGGADPGSLLDYLHHVGTVFHRPGLFGDRVIVDQQWALEAIYAVFERGSGTYTHIRERRGGRFTRGELASLLWDKAGYGEAEQRLFIDMMASCRIAFGLRAPEDGEPEYLAPDLAPPRSAVQLRLDEVWDEDADTERAAFPFDLLPPGLLRSLMAEVGELAGVSAVYWDDGFYFYDSDTRARAIVEQVREDKGYAGRIELRTQARGGDDAGGLLAALTHLVETHREQLGVTTGELRRAGGFKEWIATLWRNRGAAALNDAVERTEGLLKDDCRVGSRPALKPAPTPLPERAYFISYGRGSTAPGASVEEREREAVADAFETWCRGNKATLVRDRNELHPGDSIENFMKQIAEGWRIFLVLSAKYLIDSHYCMTEFVRIWYDCRRRPEEFRSRVIVYEMASAKISTLEDRRRIAEHWAAEADRLEHQLRAAGSRTFGPLNNAAPRTLRDIAHEAAEILAVIADMITLRSLDDIARLRPE